MIYYYKMRLYKQYFGQKLKQLLKDKKIKQVQLAEEIGVEPPNISRWVNGENFPEEVNFQKLCKVLSTNEEHFLPPVESAEDNSVFELLKVQRAYLEEKIKNLELMLDGIDHDLLLSLRKADKSQLKTVRNALGLKSTSSRRTTNS